MTPDLPALATRLARHTVAETDSLLASSARQCGVSLTERTDWRGGYTKPDGTIVAGGSVKLGWTVDAGSPAALDAARRKLAPSMTPPEADQVSMWLAELSVITARREDDAATESLRLAAYASRLREYPADVVREALMVRRWKFFPAWAELADACDALVKPRRDMLAALERARADADRKAAEASALPAPGQHHETAEERRVSAEAARAIMAEVRASLQTAQQQEDDAAAARRASAYPIRTQREEVAAE